jgi:hypothetical protein
MMSQKLSWEGDRALVPLMTGLQAATNSFRNKCQTWQDYLFLLGILPRLIFRRYSIVPSTEDESIELKKLLSNYAALSQWLYYLSSGDKPIDPDLIFTDKFQVKPRASLSKAILDLAIELQPRREELQTSLLRTPTDIWFSVECHLCDQALVQSGVITGQGTSASSKERMINNMRTVVLWLEDVEKWQPDKEVSSEVPLTLDMLLTFAALEAKENTGFRLSLAYQQICKKMCTFGNLVRSDSQFQTSCFQDGSRLPSGRSSKRSISSFVTKKLPKSR